VWLYYRFCLSHRDVEDVIAEQRILVSYETVRQWSGESGPAYARAARRHSGRQGDAWYLDEVFVTIKGGHHLWRAGDQDGDTLDILLQSRRNQQASERFFRKLLKAEGASQCRQLSDNPMLMLKYRLEFPSGAAR